MVHPPLAKVLMSFSIRLLGDNPLGWRIPSLVFGSLALLAMYWLAKAAGASRLVAVGAAGIMSLDNLFVVHGRIATLDIFVLVFMMAAAALYLRGRWGWAGIILGLGAATKLVAFFLLPMLLLYELMNRFIQPHRSAGGEIQRGEQPSYSPSFQGQVAVGACAVVAAVSFLATMTILDSAYTTFDSPLSHLSSMVGEQKQLKKGDHGYKPVAEGADLAATSTPWAWLANRKRFGYFSRSTGTPRIAFAAAVNPFVIWLAIPALALSLLKAIKTQARPPIMATAWFVGGFIPFVALDAAGRIGYLYYVLILLPAVYLSIAWLFSSAIPRKFRIVYALALFAGFAALYPFRIT
ncbi:MAG: phospholipid carrier-dependent glycosyltransferase [Actinomycetota bacterium]